MTAFGSIRSCLRYGVARVFGARWRDAEFDIRIRRKRGVKRTIVKLNGADAADGRIPVQDPGTRHRVDVMLPS